MYILYQVPSAIFHSLLFCFCIGSYIAAFTSVSDKNWSLLKKIFQILNPPSISDITLGQSHCVLKVWNRNEPQSYESTLPHFIFVQISAVYSMLFAIFFFFFSNVKIPIQITVDMSRRDPRVRILSRKCPVRILTGNWHPAGRANVTKMRWLSWIFGNTPHSWQSVLRGKLLNERRGEV